MMNLLILECSLSWFLIIFIASYPRNVLRAVLNDLNSIPAFVSRLITQWSCSIHLLALRWAHDAGSKKPGRTCAYFTANRGWPSSFTPLFTAHSHFRASLSAGA